MSYILVIEDDEGITQAMKMLLEMEGLKPKCVSTTQEALALLLVERPAVILLDFVLKGEDVTRFIHLVQTEVNPSIPIILMSASNNIGTIAQSFGIPDYVRKPFEIDALLTRVKSYLTH